MSMRLATLTGCLLRQHEDSGACSGCLWGGAASISSGALGCGPALRPYRAKTKGKVERFNRYLRYSFYVPLVSRLRQVGLILDAATANVEALRWLRDVAHARTHGTTGVTPCSRMPAEQAALLPLPNPYCGERCWRPRPPNAPPAPRVPIESLQHPLRLYQQLLVEVAP